MTQIDLSKIKLLSAEENDALNKKFAEYHSKLNKGLRQICVEAGFSEKEQITYSIMSFPIQNYLSFDYNRHKYDLDEKIDKLLEGIKTIWV